MNVSRLTIAQARPYFEAVAASLPAHTNVDTELLLSAHGTRWLVTEGDTSVVAVTVDDPKRGITHVGMVVKLSGKDAYGLLAKAAASGALPVLPILQGDVAIARLNEVLRSKFKTQGDRALVRVAADSLGVSDV